jgi:glycosyltransferase involved in cell wall biosynthesis
VRIVLLSDLERTGGAAVAASRLARGLAENGHEVVRLVHLSEPGDGPWSVTRLPGAHMVPSVIGGRLMDGGVGARLIHGLASASLNRALSQIRPDIVNVHNLHGAGWNPAMLSTCARHAPTVWSLHDMWSFTGRCAYSYDCRKFETGCDRSCPTPREYPKLPPLRIGASWAARSQLFRDHPDLCAVAPSRWLRSEALAGLWKDHRVELIPYGLPLDEFRPVPRALARARLRLPGEGMVMLMSAQDLRERRKGGAILLDALQRMAERPLTLLSLGAGELGSLPPHVTRRSLGYVKDHQALVEAYSAADLLVHPAPVDNLPNVVLESIACGTPVVGFPIGGIPDMVRPCQTGWLAKGIGAAALADAIDLALDDLDAGIELRPSCRRIAEQEYGLARQAARYTAVFEEVGTRGRATHDLAPR